MNRWKLICTIISIRKSHLDYHLAVLRRGWGQLMNEEVKHWITFPIKHSAIFSTSENHSKILILAISYPIKRS